MVDLFVEMKECFGCNGDYLLIEAWDCVEIEFTGEINL